MRSTDERYIENHMVLNTPNAPWNQPDEPDEPEPTDEERIEELTGRVERLEREKRTLSEILDHIVLVGDAPVEAPYINAAKVGMILAAARMRWCPRMSREHVAARLRRAAG
jgi:hypothetical protein